MKGLRKYKKIKGKCRDTGARFVYNDHNFLFRDGSCDTSAFQNYGVHLSTCGVKRLTCNLLLAVSKHREDGAQRGPLRRGAAIHPDRLAEGCRNRTAVLQIDLPNPSKFVKFFIHRANVVAKIYLIAKTCQFFDQSTIFFIGDGIICIALRLNQFD